MKWSEQRPDAQPRALDEALRGMAALDVIELVRVQRHGPLVVLAPDCRQRILQHLESGPTELGGLLIGWAYRDDLERFTHPMVTIHQCVPSRSYRSSSVSLAMESDLWNDARHHVAPGRGMVVGWYHSHPNLGAFFSGTDRRTQRAFFCQPYSLGLVIDPVRREEAWFVGPDSNRIPSPACIASGHLDIAP
jgi:proteasome lid subunit RPN8/RPN11